MNDEHAKQAMTFHGAHAKQATHNDTPCGKALDCGGTCCLVRRHAGKCLCGADDKDTPRSCRVGST